MSFGSLTSLVLPFDEEAMPVSSPPRVPLFLARLLWMTGDRRRYPTNIGPDPDSPPRRKGVAVNVSSIKKK